MKKILWVSDEPGWAYDINAQALALHMPQYEHHLLYTVSANKEVADQIIPGMDIVMAMNPLSFYMYSDFSKVFTIFDSVRALADVDKTKLSQVRGIICTNEKLSLIAKQYNKHWMLQTNGVDLEKYCPGDQKPTDFTLGFAANINGPYAIYKGWNVYQAAVEDLGGFVKQINVLYGTPSRIHPERMVPDFYHKISCLVLLSDDEGCSNVITEALACGIPIICTKVGYHGEMLQHGVQCLFVPKQVGAVKDAIWLMSRIGQYGIMSQAARQFAEQYHDIGVVAARYANFFEECI